MCSSAPFRAPAPEGLERCCILALSRGGVLQFLSPGTHPAKRETEDQMIKKLLLASAATALMAGAASAADLPRRAAPPPVFTPVPVFTWTGAYFGINAGYAFDASSRSTGNSFGVPFPY